MTGSATTMLADALAGRATVEEIEAALLSRSHDLPGEDVHELSAVLARYLNTLGGGVAALAAMAKDPQVGRGIAFAAGSVLLYLVDEDDFLPESEAGPLGLLDDTYLVHRCVAALRAAFPQLGAPDGYEPPDEESVGVVRSLFPAGVSDALDRTCENLARAPALFAGRGGDGTGGDDAARPPLRVAEAVGALRESR